MALESEIKKIMGKDVIFDEEQKIPYVTDASPFSGKIPFAVALPRNVKQICSLLKFCYDHALPIVTRGGGTSLTGASVSIRDSVVISMSNFNNIVEYSTADRYVIAESGVRIDDLNLYLSQYGFFYPPDPASSIAATVGGTISTNAGGLRASMYGTTKNWVLGLEIILPDGNLIRTGGKVLKKTSGYDLTSLFVGAEGTLGIIYRAILKIAPLPENTGRILAYYDSIERIGTAVSDLKASGMTPLIAEFMDRNTMDSISKARDMEFPERAQFMLMIDISSTNESIEYDLTEAQKILMNSSPVEIKITRDKEIMDKMYEARKGAYSSLLTLRKSPSEKVVIGDIVVPASALPNALKECEEASQKYNIRVALFGHIADGNIHANIYTDPESKEITELVQKYQEELGRIALKYEGSVSAEHGIGLEKKDLLRMEFSYYNSDLSLELLKGIKRVFDPKGLMNRGKMFD